MLQDLETRWRDERTPQAGVRLAEALQQQGDTVRAEGVLDTVEAQLEEHPRDLAARVAVGGLRLALGQAQGAARVLEQVVEADATHLKANKLLVEVYLELNQRDRARDRLDLYRLLNEGDPEIEALEGLVVGVTVPPAEAAPPESPPVVMADGRGRRLRVSGGNPFAELTAEAPLAPGPGPLEDLMREPPAAPAATATGATATLGDLYREQGHRDDAERVFRDVLTEEPGNLRARQGLAELAADNDKEPAALVALAAADDADGEDPERRRIAVLRGYLARIQRGREALAR